MSQGLDEILDIEALSELQELLEEDFVALIQEFIHSSEKGSAELVQLLGLPDHDALKRGAHSLKGSALNIGVPSLATCWSELESAAGSMAPKAELEGLLVLAQDQLEKAVIALRKHFC